MCGTSIRRKRGVAAFIPLPVGSFICVLCCLDKTVSSARPKGALFDSEWNLGQCGFTGISLLALRVQVVHKVGAKEGRARGSS